MNTHTHDTTSGVILSLLGATIFLLVISLATNVITVAAVLGYDVPFISSVSERNSVIRQTLLELEYEKVGGQKNYETLQKYSQKQINDQIGQIEAIVNNTGNPTQPTQPQPQAQPTSTLSADDIKKIIDDAYLEGNKSATIVAIEYSDMECPFCMRQYHDTKLFPNLLAQYKDTVAVAFKNNRGVNHKGTEAKALGTLCAGKIGGGDAYNKFYKGIMDKSTNEAGVLDVSKLPDVAKTTGLDLAKWQSCFDSKETLPRFSAQTQEAQKYGLGGTPGTLVLNVKTGKYKTIEGAYPYETFTAAIDELLK